MGNDGRGIRGNNRSESRESEVKVSREFRVIMKGVVGQVEKLEVGGAKG